MPANKRPAAKSVPGGQIAQFFLYVFAPWRETSRHLGEKGVADFDLFLFLRPRDRNACTLTGP
jgi:hypothetical protein